MSEYLPKISIVTPSYNQGDYLEKTINSVLQQDYPNLEYIVIDGGSTDNSAKILQQYDSHIDYWVSEPDSGQSDAINKGFKRCSGEIINWLNSDDILLPNALHAVANAFVDSDQQVGAVLGRGKIIDCTGALVHEPVPYDVNYENLLRWLSGNDFMQPSCFFRRSVFEEVGPLNEDLHYCMDIDLWLKIAKRYQFKPIPELLSHALSHENAKTTANTARMRMETLLMYTLHNEFDIAVKEGNNLADELHKSYAEYKIVRNNPFFRLILRPFLRKKLKAAGTSS